MNISKGCGSGIETVERGEEGSESWPRDKVQPKPPTPAKVVSGMDVTIGLWDMKTGR
ncbi:MAG: hypothetical protein HC849_13555 [Oscillatoriales cyanobacterium RU_3_3]|nr:hypothetical protein [Oscillatoriales cyanobacterium RU_3_3]